MKRHGLTLTEVVVFLVILAVMGMGLGALWMSRERARRKRCASQLKCLGLGIHLYSSDFEEAFPESFGYLYAEFVSDGGVWLCPSARKATKLEEDPGFLYEKYTPAMFGDTHTDYVYVSGLTAADPASYVLAFDDEDNHAGVGVCVVYVPTSVEWVTDIEALHRQLAKQEKELAAQGRTMQLLRPAWSRGPEIPAPPASATKE